MEGAAKLKVPGRIHRTDGAALLGNHKTTHNKIHRLDALDAYKPEVGEEDVVRGITVKGLAGNQCLPPT